MKIIASIIYHDGQGTYKLWSPILRNRLEAGHWLQSQSDQYSVIESKIHEIADSYATVLEGVLFPLDNLLTDTSHQE